MASRHVLACARVCRRHHCSGLNHSRPVSRPVAHRLLQKNKGRRGFAGTGGLFFTRREVADSLPATLTFIIWGTVEGEVAEWWFGRRGEGVVVGG